MDELIAFCGLDCMQCGAFIATQANDDQQRREVAALWSKEFGGDIRADQINCDGCVAESPLRYQHCQVCEIRTCGVDKGVLNCAHCSEYPCSKLAEFLSNVPEAKIQLDRIHTAL